MNSDLLRLLACPDCLGPLAEEADRLRCAACGASYDVNGGIPFLYPGGMDYAHLRAERHLANVMKSVESLPTESYRLAQWDLSKQEFWAMVAGNVRPSPCVLVNIGCGYDQHFKQFEQRGDLFVNFDLVPDMLVELRDKAGARSCVCGDINRLPFHRGAFDHVVSIDVIHHESDNLDGILRAFWDLLKPGGKLFLEDPNAWGLFQMAKSMVLPRPLYRVLRSSWHRVKRSAHAPADYEFPTNVRKVVARLRCLGFQDVKIYPHRAYPNIGRASHQLYRALSRSEYVRKYHNYHYMLSATRPY